jgi:hypothetical protein
VADQANHLAAMVARPHLGGTARLLIKTMIFKGVVILGLFFIFSSAKGWSALYNQALIADIIKATGIIHTNGF